MQFSVLKLFSLVVIFDLFSFGWLGNSNYDMNFVAIAFLRLSLAIFVLASSNLKKELFLFNFIFECIFFFTLMPGATNHHLISLFISLGCLFFYIGDNLTLNILRYVIVILYFFAFFHKFNYDFLDSELSCANFFFNRTFAEYIPFIKAEFFQIIFPYGVLVLELALPFLLYFSKYRRLGVLFGLIFHLLLAYDFQQRFYNFSVVMYLLLLACDVEYLKSSLFSEGKVIFKKFTFINFIGLSIVFAILYFHLLNFNNDIFIFFRLVGLIWILFSLLVIYDYISFLIINRFDYRVSLASENVGVKIRYLQYLFIVSVFVNGLGPYIGFRTRLSFDMYSNIIVENNMHNHVLFGSGLDIFSQLKDLIQIVYVDDENIDKNYVKKNLLITPFEFKNLILGYGGNKLIYRYKGEIKTLSSQERDGILNDRGHRILRKIVVFRPVQNLKNSCIW